MLLLVLGVKNIFIKSSLFAPESAESACPPPSWTFELLHMNKKMFGAQGFFQIADTEVHATVGSSVVDVYL